MNEPHRPTPPITPWCALQAMDAIYSMDAPDDIKVVMLIAVVVIGFAEWVIGT